MVACWKKTQIKLLLDLFCRNLPIIDVNNALSGHNLKKFIDECTTFNNFEDLPGGPRTFYADVRRYAAQFCDNKAVNAKVDKIKGKFV